MPIIDLLDSDPAPQPGDGGYVGGQNYILGWILTQVGTNYFLAPPSNFPLVREWQSYPDAPIIVDGQLTAPPAAFFTDGPFSAPEWSATIIFGVGGPSLDSADAIANFHYVITSPTNGERTRNYIAGGVLFDQEETDFAAEQTFSEWAISANDILTACGLDTTTEVVTMRSGVLFRDASHVDTPTDSGEANAAISRLPSLHATTVDEPPDDPPEGIGLGEPQSGRVPIGGF